MLEKLFKFPIIRVDDKTERNSLSLGLKSEEDVPDFAVVQVEYPYFDFVGIEDAWMPNDTESFEKAKEGIFDHCLVRFSHTHQMLVPWSRKEFKKKFENFVSVLMKKEKEEEEKNGLPLIRISREKFQSLLDEAENEDKDKKDE